MARGRWASEEGMGIFREKGGKKAQARRRKMTILDNFSPFLVKKCGTSLDSVDSAVFAELLLGLGLLFTCID